MRLKQNEVRYRPTRLGRAINTIADGLPTLTVVALEQVQNAAVKLICDCVVFI